MRVSCKYKFGESREERFYIFGEIKRKLIKEIEWLFLTHFNVQLS